MNLTPPEKIVDSRRDTARYAGFAHFAYRRGIRPPVNIYSQRI